MKLTKATKFEVLGSKGQVIAVFKVKKLKRTRKPAADKIVTVYDIRNNWQKESAKATLDYHYDADINLTQKSIIISGFHIKRDYNQVVKPGGILGREIVENRIYFEKSFSLNDTAEYDSYNLRYTAPITNITASYVEFTIKGYSKKRRLSLAEFIRRNYKLDLQKLAEENAETRMCI